MTAWSFSEGFFGSAKMSNRGSGNTLSNGIGVPIYGSKDLMLIYVNVQDK